MDRIGSKFGLLKEKVKSACTKINELKKENKKLKEINEQLYSKMIMFEEENKMARKYIKERDIIKTRVKNIVDNIERAKI